jgi:hypothetical protein
VGSKTTSTAFIVVDTKGKYNALLSRDWIHANGCVPSTLHQCVIQWIGNEVEVIKADESVCMAVTKLQEGLQEGEVKCLTGRDLSEYDYISVGRDGFVPVNVKPTILGQLENLGVNP